MNNSNTSTCFMELLTSTSITKFQACTHLYFLILDGHFGSFFSSLLEKELFIALLLAKTYGCLNI
jgi:hypothetical protein